MNTIDLTGDCSDGEPENNPTAIAQALERFKKPAPPRPTPNQQLSPTPKPQTQPRPALDESHSRFQFTARNNADVVAPFFPSTSVLPSLESNSSRSQPLQESSIFRGSSLGLPQPARQGAESFKEHGIRGFPSGPRWGFFSANNSAEKSSPKAHLTTSIPSRPRSPDVSRKLSNEGQTKDSNTKRKNGQFKVPQRMPPRPDPAQRSLLTQESASHTPVTKNVAKPAKPSHSFQGSAHISPPLSQPSHSDNKRQRTNTPKSSAPSSSVTPTDVSSSSEESPPPQPKFSRQTFVGVEIAVRRPFSSPNNSSDVFGTIPPSLKRKFIKSKESLISGNDRASQLKRRDSSDASTTSTESSVGVDPTDFSLANDDRDFPSLFEPRAKTVDPKKRVLEFSDTLLKLRSARGTPYQRVLHQYQEKLAQIPGPPTTFSNTEDELLPDGKFEFIETYILHAGVDKVPDDFNTGCSCFPRGDASSGGCDLASCGCVLQDGTGEGNGVRPYRMGLDGVVVLTDDILPLTVSIFECNKKCDCDDSCMNRVVQHGRTVPLEIFRASQRGFGLRTLGPLQKGQFIDLYLGEVLTANQTKRREESHSTAKGSYLFALDMFENNSKENYVVDGRYKGNATRFMNHSCKPNCKLFTVLCDHADLKVYDLAFFAVKDIPEGTELTFDYNPNFEEGKGATSTPGRGRKGARSNVVEDEVAADCLCGEDNCRGKVWL